MPASQWTLADVEALIAQRIPEGQRLEYKEDLSLDRERDRAEIAKDLSGLANAQGGLLIYGVAEDESEEPRPDALSPLAKQGQQTRLEDIVDSAVHPRLNYECHTLDAGEGSLLIVRVSPRAGGPHMVQSYKQHRYFVRRGTRTVPMSEDEVRAGYEAARTSADRVGELLAALPLLPRIGRNRDLDVTRMMAAGITRPTEWLPLVSVVTAPLVASAELLPPAALTEQSFPEPTNLYVGRRRPVRHVGHFTIDALGLVEEESVSMESGQPSQVRHRVRLYRQGVCEWARRYGVRDPYAIPSSSFAQDVHNVFVYFASVYAAVRYSGPVALYVRIDNAEKSWLAVNSRLTDWPSEVRADMESIGVYRETTTDAVLGDSLALVRDMMLVIWQAYGYSRCLLFDKNGDWILDE